MEACRVVERLVRAIRQGRLVWHALPGSLHTESRDLEDIGRDWPDWQQMLAKYRLKQPHPIEGLTFNSYQICLEAAENGHGIALGWRRSVQTKLDDGKLVRLPGCSLPVPEAVYVYRHRSRPVDSIIEEFTATIKTEIEPTPAD